MNEFRDPFSDLSHLEESPLEQLARAVWRLGLAGDGEINKGLGNSRMTGCVLIAQFEGEKQGLRIHISGDNGAMPYWTLMGLREALNRHVDDVIEKLDPLDDGE